MMPVVQQRIKKTIMGGKQPSLTEYSFGFVLIGLMVLVLFVDKGVEDLQNCAFEFGTDALCVVVPILISCVFRRGSKDGTGPKAVDAKQQYKYPPRTVSKMTKPRSLEVVKKQDKPSLNSAILACVKRGDIIGAEQQIQAARAQNILPDPSTYNILIDSYARLKDVEGAQKWFRRMVDDGVTPNNTSYAVVLQMYARQGDIDQASWWLRQMISDGIAPLVANYNSLIHACGVQGDLDGAEKWVLELEDGGLEVREATMAAVINMCANARDADRAEKWMHYMKARGIEPNVDICRAMVDVCAQASNTSGAVQWFKALQMLGGVPNDHAMATLVNLSAQEGDAVSAVWWLSSMEASGLSPDVDTCSRVLDLCLKIKDTEQAKVVYWKMHKKGVHPNIVTYASLARALAHSGEWREVEALACHMQKCGTAMNDYFLYALLLAYATSKPRQSRRAEQAFQDASNLGVSMNGHVLSALQRAVGRTRGQELIDEFQLKVGRGHNWGE